VDFGGKRPNRVVVPFVQLPAAELQCQLRILAIPGGEEFPLVADAIKQGDESIDDRALGGPLRGRRACLLQGLPEGGSVLLGGLRGGSDDPITQRLDLALKGLAQVTALLVELLDEAFRELHAERIDVLRDRRSALKEALSYLIGDNSVPLIDERDEV